MKRSAPAVLSDHTTSIRVWRERLIRLNESTLLDIVRNYLGDVRTPFNKQELLLRLESFLALPDIQERIIAFLSLRDRQLLSGIQLCQGSSEAELFRLFGNGRSFVDFHLQLLNLEDRLLAFREEELGGMYINPHLQSLLAPYLSEALVVETTPIVDLSPLSQSNTALWFDETFLAALYSFLLEKPELLGAQGVIKKRPLEEFKARFSGIAELTGTEKNDDNSKEILEYALRGLSTLGLIQMRGALLVPVYDRWAEFATVKRDTALMLLWAACLEPPESIEKNGVVSADNSSYFAPSHSATFARTMVSWLSKLSPEQAYADSALHLLWEIHTGIKMEGAARERFFAGLKLFGIFRRWGGLWQPHPELSNLEQYTLRENKGTTALTLTPSFEASLTGTLRMEELIVLSSCGSLRFFGRIPIWELNRESCQRGYAKGIEPHRLLELLALHTGRVVPQNIAFSCADWHRDFSSVQIWDGIVLVCEGARRTVIEHLEALKPWILSQPAPGVVVLDRSGTNEWLAILASVGIPASILGMLDRTEISSTSTGNAPVPAFMPSFASMDLHNIAVIWPSDTRDTQETTILSPPAFAINAQELRTQFLAKLATSGFLPEIQEELEKHIRNSLILREEQLSATTVRPDRSEARGLDYNAKIRVMEQAIKNRRDFLELTQNNGAGTAYTLLVWPQKLRQTGSELILSAQTVPEGKELSIMTGKVSLVRRIRATLFS